MENFLISVLIKLFDFLIKTIILKIFKFLKLKIKKSYFKLTRIIHHFFYYIKIYKKLDILYARQCEIINFILDDEIKYHKLTKEERDNIKTCFKELIEFKEGGKLYSDKYFNPINH